MAYASQAGRARVNAKKSQAFAVCDRCGIWYNHVDLAWQMDWRGTSIQNLRILVCRSCRDKPQEQLRAIVLPSDPDPIINARTQDFDLAESDYRSPSAPTVFDPITGLPIPGTSMRVTEDCNQRTLFPYGLPVGLDQNAVMPYNGGNQMHYGVPLNLISVTSNGTSTVTVTCSSVHGLQNEGPNSQVSIEGLGIRAANGFYSVIVISATAFTYMTYGLIAADALLTPTTRIITALVGLPRGYKRIPQIYGPTLIPETAALVCFFELEDGSGMFGLEDGTGFLQIEQCMQPPLSTFFFALEDDTGDILLENGADFLELENGP